MNFIPISGWCIEDKLVTQDMTTHETNMKLFILELYKMINKCEK